MNVLGTWNVSKGRALIFTMLRYSTVSIFAISAKSGNKQAIF